MDKVIQIDEYRRRHSPSAEASREIWSCGECGGKAWTVTTCGALHCLQCDTKAENLKLADLAPPPPSVAKTSAPPPGNPFVASAPWWWAWARQS